MPKHQTRHKDHYGDPLPFADQHLRPCDKNTAAYLTAILQ